MMYTRMIYTGKSSIYLKFIHLIGYSVWLTRDKSIPCVYVQIFLQSGHAGYIIIFLQSGHAGYIIIL